MWVGEVYKETVNRRETSSRFFDYESTIIQCFRGLMHGTGNRYQNRGETWISSEFRRRREETVAAILKPPFCVNHDKG